MRTCVIIGGSCRIRYYANYVYSREVTDKDGRKIIGFYLILFLANTGFVFCACQGKDEAAVSPQTVFALKKGVEATRTSFALKKKREATKTHLR